MVENELRSCRYCFERIKPLAQVCPHCSRAQRPFMDFFNRSDVMAGLIATLIAMGTLVLGFMQLRQAGDANLKAQFALERASTAEAQVLETCRAVKHFAQTLIQIADVVPRTDAGAAFQGGSLSREDRALLKTKQDALRAQILSSKC